MSKVTLLLILQQKWVTRSVKVIGHQTFVVTKIRFGVIWKWVNYDTMIIFGIILTLKVLNLNLMQKVLRRIVFAASVCWSCDYAESAQNSHNLTDVCNADGLNLVICVRRSNGVELVSLAAAVDHVTDLHLFTHQTLFFSKQEVP